MSISVNVHLLSGKRATVEVEADASVESLKRRAHSALAVPSRGRLLNSSGEMLDGAQTVTEAELRSGDVLTLHVNQVQIKVFKAQNRGSQKAFAAILGDGSVVTWGPADYGGDSSAVQDHLRGVQQIQASTRAFAAIRSDGSVVTWGDADWGGDSSVVQEQLRDVQQIQASADAFAAIL
ncbi:gyaR, partial [Symbiodinium sp. KB8]